MLIKIKAFIGLILVFTSLSCSHNEKTPQTMIRLSKDIFKPVPFSSIYINHGALIKNINYQAVKDLIPQLEKIYSVELEDRKESHITVITPPEAQGWSNPKKIGINNYISPREIHRWNKKTLQQARFKPLCIGMQRNSKGHRTFYIVVESSELFSIRKKIQAQLERRASTLRKKTYFKAQNFYPHITIGFIGNDIHEVSKGPETCVEDIEYF